MSNLLSIENLNVFYDSSQVLFNLKLILKKNETLALLGRNGAGKSTTIKAIAGIIPSKSGIIKIKEKTITNFPSFKIARLGLGYVPEDRQIFTDLTVEDNLMIAAKKGINGQNDWSLEKVYEMLPLLKPLTNRLGGQLSGGEQQMLTIGRSLMGNPDLILLDEPSEGLAPIMVQKIGDLISDLRKIGKSIILAEQNLHFCLDIADKAVVIDKGSDVFQGSISELNSQSEIKKKYLSV